MTEYEIIETERETIIKKINADGSFSFIPADPANSDYQRYLNPEAEQPIGGNK
jgi:hypothetical protein